MIKIDQQLLDEIAQAANDAGKDGRRIHTVQIIKAATAAGRDAFVFVEDNGPRMASEQWRGQP